MRNTLKRLVISIALELIIRFVFDQVQRYLGRNSIKNDDTVVYLANRREGILLPPGADPRVVGQFNTIVSKVRSGGSRQ